MPSRRRFLAAGALGVGSLTPLAGCTEAGAVFEDPPDQRLWSTALGDRIDAHAVTEQGLFAATATGSHDDRSYSVVRVDADTGDEQWRRPLDGRITEFHVHGAEVSLATIQRDESADPQDSAFGELLAFDGAGGERWRTSFSEPVESLAGDESGVYAIGGRVVEAFDHDGTERWTVDLPETGAQVAVDDGVVVVVSARDIEREEAVTALDATTGEQVWRRTWETIGVSTRPPVADDEHVYLPFGRMLGAFDRETGEQAWLRSFGQGVVRSLGTYNGNVLVATATDTADHFGTVYRLSGRSGFERREYRFGSPVTDAAFRLDWGYVLTDGGTFAVVGSDHPYELDLGWGENRGGSIDIRGDWAYLATPDGALQKFAGPVAMRQRD